MSGRRKSDGQTVRYRARLTRFCGTDALKVIVEPVRLLRVEPPRYHATAFAALKALLKEVESDPARYIDEARAAVRLAVPAHVLNEEIEE